MSVHTHKIPSQSSKKSRPLWPLMMDDNAPTYGIRQLIKTYKNVLPQNRIVVAEYAGRPTPKMEKRWNRKTARNVRKT